MGLYKMMTGSIVTARNSKQLRPFHTAAGNLTHRKNIVQNNSRHLKLAINKGFLDETINRLFMSADLSVS